MASFPVQPLQAALLFDDPGAPGQRVPDWDLLAEAVNLHPAHVGPELALHHGPPGSFEARLTTSELTARVVLHDTPLPLPGFATELGHALYTRLRPELAAQVRAHRAAALVEVARRDGLPPEDQAAFDRRLLVTAALAATLTRAMGPGTVHWAQSHQLFLGAEFIGLAADPFPLALFVQPGFFSDGRRVNGSYATGVEALGAAHLIGQHVRFEPHPQDMQQSYLAVLTFVDACRYAGRLPRNRAIFGAEGAPPIEVSLQPGTAAHPAGIISLRQREVARARGGPASIRPGDRVPWQRLRELVRLDTLQAALIAVVVLAQLVLFAVWDMPFGLSAPLVTARPEMSTPDDF
ncbi:hypothetical protein [Mesobacterium pallidum]|uniref:hypothetical protein n=1 Tax=Mesobacterium pallidum TaxID=2872037 RepID=UPI001EE183BA|nr:hypothetical protein [Mesobacterium pallidum]